MSKHCVQLQPTRRLASVSLRWLWPHSLQLHSPSLGMARPSDCPRGKNNWPCRTSAHCLTRTTSLPHLQACVKAGVDIQHSFKLWSAVRYDRWGSCRKRWAGQWDT